MVLEIKFKGKQDKIAFFNWPGIFYTEEAIRKIIKIKSYSKKFKNTKTVFEEEKDTIISSHLIHTKKDLSQIVVMDTNPQDLEKEEQDTGKEFINLFYII